MLDNKPLYWLGGAVIRTPPVGKQARRDLGAALRVLQRGGQLSMPLSKTMQSLGARCHELRVRDAGKQWRLIYRLDADAILIIDVFRKTTQKTPKQIIDRCKRRLRLYDKTPD